VQSQNTRVLAQLSAQTETVRYVLYPSIALTLAAIALSLLLHFWRGLTSTTSLESPQPTKTQLPNLPPEVLSTAVHQ
jgi:hypothetical protein